MPQKKIIESSNIWFESQPLGHNQIDNFMKKISKLLNLQKIYTNHCVRATAITLLSQSFSENDIKSISGHQSISALGIYKHISDNKKQEMSAYLTQLTQSPTESTQPSTPPQVFPTKSNLLQNFSNHHSNNNKKVKFDIDVDIDIDVDHDEIYNNPNSTPFNKQRSQNLPMFYNCSNITINFNQCK